MFNLTHAAFAHTQTHTHTKRQTETVNSNTILARASRANRHLLLCQIRIARSLCPGLLEARVTPIQVEFGPTIASSRASSSYTLSDSKGQTAQPNHASLCHGSHCCVDEMKRDPEIALLTLCHSIATSDVHKWYNEGIVSSNRLSVSQCIRDATKCGIEAEQQRERRLAPRIPVQIGRECVSV